jgi:hypothetical protein
MSTEDLAARRLRGLRQIRIAIRRRASRAKPRSTATYNNDLTADRPTVAAVQALEALRDLATLYWWWSMTKRRSTAPTM